MKGRIVWKRLFRRCGALFLATLAVWLLILCGGASGALESLGGNGTFVATALAAELGGTGIACAPCPGTAPQTPAEARQAGAFPWAFRRSRAT